MVSSVSRCMNARRLGMSIATTQVAAPLANSRAAGTAAAASRAAPSQETSMTARVEEAAVPSKPSRSRADSTGKALTAIGTASTA